jgi:hypothetical protein
MPCNLELGQHHRVQYIKRDQWVNRKKRTVKKKKKKNV